MFTGIIQALGQVMAMEHKGNDLRMRLHTGSLTLDDVKEGDSIAVNGVCLTVALRTSEGFWVDVSAETLRLTSLGLSSPGQRVNLEKSLTPSTPMGGHFVMGHVDGVGMVSGMQDEGRSLRLNITVPERLAKYIAVKGSISVDGVSLTVNAIEDTEFSVNIIPHTLKHTIISDYIIGNSVNIEVDLVARYLERLLSAQLPLEPGQDNIALRILRQYGYLRPVED